MSGMLDWIEDYKTYVKLLYLAVCNTWWYLNILLIIAIFYNRVKAKLQEVAPDRVDPFMANAPAEVKKILGNIKNFQVSYSNRWNCTKFVYA